MNSLVLHALVEAAKGASSTNYTAKEEVAVFC